MQGRCKRSARSRRVRAPRAGFRSGRGAIALRRRRRVAARPIAKRKRNPTSCRKGRRPEPRLLQRQSGRSPRGHLRRRSRASSQASARSESTWASPTAGPAALRAVAPEPAPFCHIVTGRVSVGGAGVLPTHRGSPPFVSERVRTSITWRPAGGVQQVARQGVVGCETAGGGLAGNAGTVTSWLARSRGWYRRRGR